MLTDHFRDPRTSTDFLSAERRKAVRSVRFAAPAILGARVPLDALCGKIIGITSALSFGSKMKASRQNPKASDVLRISTVRFDGYRAEIGHDLPQGGCRRRSDGFRWRR